MTEREVHRLVCQAYTCPCLLEEPMDKPKCTYPNCARKTRGERYRYCDRCRRALRLCKEGKVGAALALYPIQK